MATLRFLLKRFVAQRLLGLAIVVTLAFTIGVLVAGPIYADAAREAILASAVRSASVTVVNVRLSVYADETFDYAGADAAVKDAEFRLPVSALVRQGLGTARLEANGVTLSVPLLFRDDIQSHLDIKGETPGEGQIALAASQAKTLGVKRGDRLTAIGPSGKTVELTVSGTFPPPDREDPFWFGDRNPFPAPDSTDPQPAVLSPDGYLAAAKHLRVTTEYAWDGYTDFEGVPFTIAERVPAQIAQIADGLASDPAFAGRQTQVSSGLDTLMELVRQRVSNLRVPIFLVVFQIGAVTLAVLAGVGSLTLTRQSFELAVLRSRGFSRGKLIAAQGVQAAFSALIAFPIGLALGALLAKLASFSNGPSLPGVLFPIRVSGQAQLLGLVGALAGAGILLLLSLPHISRTILEERRLLSREQRPLLARYPIEAFVLPLGIFAFIEVRNRGGVGPSRTGDIDPLILLAPTLLIFGLSFLALRLLLFVLKRLDRTIGRKRDLATYLAGRRLGRSPGTSFATSLLLVLSVGLLVVSTSYRAIVIRNHEDSARQQLGGDWQIQVAPPDQPLVSLRNMPDDTTPVVRTAPALDGGTFKLPPQAFGVDPDTYASAGYWRGDYSSVGLNAWLDAIRVPRAGVPVTAGVEALRLSVDVERLPRQELLLQATFEKADGTVSTADATLQRTAEYSLATDGAERLLSITVEQPGVGDLPAKIALTLREVTLGTEALDVSGWQSLRWRGSDEEMTLENGLTHLVIHHGAGHVIGGIAPPSGPLPALVSPGIAEQEGEVFEATLGGQRLEFRRVATASTFPTVGGDFIVVSLPALLESAARVPEAGAAIGEVWAMGGEDPVPALHRAGFVTGEVQASEPIIAVLSQLPQSLALGMHFTAAAGGLGLVVIGVAVGLYFAQRRREFEFASLRAMGMQPGQIRRVLVLEQSILIGFALAAGAVLGFGILKLMMPYVGKSLGAAVPPPILVVDGFSFALAIVAIVIATALGLRASLGALLRASVTGVLRGEAE